LTNGHNIPYADIVFNLSKHLLWSHFVHIKLN
jgi:hypothetical protein